MSTVGLNGVNMREMSSRAWSKEDDTVRTRDVVRSRGETTISVDMAGEDRLSVGRRER